MAWCYAPALPLRLLCFSLNKTTTLKYIYIYNIYIIYRERESLVLCLGVAPAFCLFVKNTPLYNIYRERETEKELGAMPRHCPCGGLLFFIKNTSLL
jgi:hypothetical protein